MSVLKLHFIAVIAGIQLAACSSSKRRANRSHAERQPEPGGAK